MYSKTLSTKSCENCWYKYNNKTDIFIKQPHLVRDTKFHFQDLKQNCENLAYYKVGINRFKLLMQILEDLDENEETIGMDFRTKLELIHEKMEERSEL